MRFSFAFYLRYHGGKWRTLRIVEPEPEPDIFLHAAESFHEPPNL